MSRSRRKTPITGITTAESDGAWKAKAARKLRHRVKQVLTSKLDGDAFAGKRWDLVNPWNAPKDGKWWHRNPDPRWMRSQAQHSGPLGALRAKAFSYIAASCGEAATPCVRSFQSSP